MRVRKTLGESQEQAAERLEPHLGVRWSKAVYSAAERSYFGKRVRQFTAADVAAFAAAFQVPLLYFFVPPKPEDREAGGVMIGDQFVAWPDLLDKMLDGKQQSALQLRLIELPANEWPKNRSQLPALGIGAWSELPHLEDSPQTSLWRSSPPSDELRAKPPIVAAIVTSDRGVLLSRRNDREPEWGFITGEQDAVKEENPADTAVREVKEETGLRIVAGDEIGRRVHPVTNRLMVYVAAKPALRASLDVTAEDERLYPLYHLAAYFGLRRSELASLAWSDVDLAARRVHVRRAQVDGELDSTKSEDSDRIVVIDQETADVLRAWRKVQLAERMAWAGAWSDTGRVFTREDGTALRPAHVSERFDTLVARLGLPPVTLHGLRHGSATMALAAGVPIKAISEMLGHATSAFTMDVYAEVAEELAEAAAVAIAAFIPRRAKTVPNGASNDR